MIILFCGQGHDVVSQVRVHVLMSMCSEHYVVIKNKIQRRKKLVQRHIFQILSFTQIGAHRIFTLKSEFQF